MKTKKAKSWETISEGIVTLNDITNLTDMRWPIVLNLLSVSGPATATIQVVPVRGPAYNVLNGVHFSPPTKVNLKPYKYLSAAVRRAVKEYKVAIRSGNWKMLTK